jgi:UDP-glucose 6-dehydrogenase
MHLCANTCVVRLSAAKCEYPILLSCTVCPNTTTQLQKQYASLHLFHCPEFLSCATRDIDMRHTKQILLGVPQCVEPPGVVPSCAMIEYASAFLRKLHPHALLRVVKATESEIAKLFCNVFYSIKLRTFNGIYSVCQSNGAHYDIVRQLMIDQGWIHPLHTYMPSANGRLGVGGECLPKDCEAAYKWMETHRSRHTEDACTWRDVANRVAPSSPPDDLQSMLAPFITPTTTRT